MSDDCRGCALHDAPALARRDFLQRALGALAAIGLAGMPLREVQALGGAGNSRRYQLPAADGAQIDKASEVILVRWKGSVYAFALSCPHQNTALRWADGEQRFQCPKHKSRYQPDGTFISGRATRNMDRLRITRDGGAVVVDLDTVYESDTDEAGWTTAVVKA